MLRPAILRPGERRTVRAAHPFFPRHRGDGVARLAALGSVLFFILHAGNHSPGADEPDKAERDQQSRRRLEFMQSAIGELKASSADIENDAALKIGKTP